MNFSLKAFVNKITPYFSSNWSRSFLWFFEFLLKLFQPTEAATDGVLFKKSVLHEKTCVAASKQGLRNKCFLLIVGNFKELFLFQDTSSYVFYVYEKLANELNCQLMCSLIWYDLGLNLLISYVFYFFFFFLGGGGG